MTRWTGCIGIALVGLLVAPAVGQVATAAPPPAAEAPPEAQVVQQLAGGEVDPVQLMRQMGADDEAVMFFQLMSQVMGADAGQMLLLMMLADKGGMDDDIMGLLFLMKAMQGGAKQPLALLDGNALIVVENGTVYKINIGTMQIEGTVAYRGAKGGGADITALMPFITQARQRAQDTACMSNMKQLCLATQMHIQETGEVLPTEQWQDQLANYVGDRDRYTCPQAAQEGVAYAINEAVIGALIQDIRRPGQTVLFFESDTAAELPFGGVDAVPGQPRHDGSVVVGFVDGHVQRMTPDELRKLLAQDPFQ